MQAAIRILLVDDEEDFVETLSKRLAKRGLSVLTALRGERALELLDANPVDVVVLDVKMPGLDGLEVLKRVKAGHPRVEVVLLTGHADMDAAIQGMELGAFDYLMKPTSIEELLYKIEDAHKKKLLREQQAGGRT
jgi:DNA-binding NtrC family response regulator